MFPRRTAFLLLALTLLVPTITATAQITIRRASLRTGGAVEGNDDSHIGSGTDAHRVISDNGRWVVFWSKASNLVATDTVTCPDPPYLNVPDVFVHDRQTFETKGLSVSTSGVSGNAPSWRPAISGENVDGRDGRYVVFQSQATNLDELSADTNAVQDIYVRDRDSDNDGIYDEAGAVRTSRVSFGLTDPANQKGRVQANAACSNPSISDNGRYVAFESDASNLVGTDDANGVTDVFLVDRDFDGDGNYDEIAAPPPNDVWDFQIWRASKPEHGIADSSPGAGDAGRRAPAIRGSGRYVVFQSFWGLDPLDLESSRVWDAYIFDRMRAVYPLNPNTYAPLDLVSIGGLGKGNNSSRSPYLANIYTAFESQAGNFGDSNPAPGTRFVYVRNQALGTLSLAVSRSKIGVLPLPSAIACSDLSIPLAAHCFDPSISSDGRFVAFHSKAVNLIDGQMETNRGVDLFNVSTVFNLCQLEAAPPTCDAYDVFLRDRDFDGDGCLDLPADGSGLPLPTSVDTIRVSSTPSGIAGNNSSIYASVSRDGHWVVFESLASDLVTAGPADTNGRWDVFVWERAVTPVGVCGEGFSGLSIPGWSDDDQ